MIADDPNADPLDGMVVVSETVPESVDKRKVWSDFVAQRRAKVPAAAK